MYGRKSHRNKISYWYFALPVLSNMFTGNRRYYDDVESSSSSLEAQFSESSSRSSDSSSESGSVSSDSESEEEEQKEDVDDISIPPELRTKIINAWMYLMETREQEFYALDNLKSKMKDLIEKRMHWFS